jgi:hypothetical protein
MSLQINLAEVEKALSILLEQLRAAKGEVIELEQPVDFYWSVPPEARYDPYHEPSELTLGQLTDDLEEIKKLAEGRTPPVALDLAKVGAVLAMLGDRTVW